MGQKSTKRDFRAWHLLCAEANTTLICGLIAALYEAEPTYSAVYVVAGFTFQVQHLS